MTLAAEQQAAPIDPATPAGAAAERQLNEVLGGVLARLDREARAAALTTEQHAQPA